jgi:hypothetical protein
VPGQNTRLGLATVIVWHNAGHHGQMLLYLRETNIVPPASRANPPELHSDYWHFEALFLLVRFYTNLSNCTFTYRNTCLHVFVQLCILGKGALCLPKPTQC